MINLVIGEDVDVTLWVEPVKLQTGHLTLSFSGLELLMQDDKLIILGKQTEACVEFLQTLSRMDEPELFDALNRQPGAFLFVVHFPATGETRIISDRTGHLKLFFSLSKNGLQLTDNLMLFGSEMRTEWADNAICEYLHYRWNNSNSSYFADVQQIFYGEYLVFHNNVLVKRTKYNNVFWRDVFLQDRSRGDLHTVLLQAIQRNLNSELPTFVLLSGGVDSALLLALTKEIDPKVIAITPNHHQHPNPELERAKQFANALKVQHRILDIDDSEIPDLFEQTTLCSQQPPRHQSSLSLYRTLASIETPANILYGVAADILFGSGMVKNFRARQHKIRQKNKLPVMLQRLLISLLPKSSKLALLLQDSVADNFLSYEKIGNPTGFEQNLAISKFQPIKNDFYRRYGLNQDSLEQLPEAELICLFKQWMLDTSVAHHILETGQMSTLFDHHLVVPFFDESVLNFARQLTAQEYYGGSHVKPLLRELGALFYPEEWMYYPKLGFPVPHESWLSCELEGLVEAARDRFSVHDLPVDTELSWTLAGLHVLCEKWHVNMKFI